ncbi:MAG: hypothetical protein V4751_11915 [Pseudomonadota bacterium]
MKDLIKSLFLIASFCSAPVWAQWGEISEIDISPAAITDRSHISVSVKGLKGDPCVRVANKFAITGNKITIDATLTTDPAALCVAVIVPLEFTQEIGSLAPGEYVVQVRINEALSSTQTTLSVVSHGYSQRKLTLTPASGTYFSKQKFDFGMVLEHSESIVSGEAFLFGKNTGTQNWVNVSTPLLQCLKQGQMTTTGKTYRCPGFSDFLTVGTHTMVVKLRLTDGTEVRDAVTWTVLGSAE